MHLEALVRALVGRDDGRVANQRIMDARIWHQVCLELVQVDVECAIKAQARSNGAHDLGDEAVQVLVVRTWNVEIATADVIDGLVIDKEGAV